MGRSVGLGWVSEGGLRERWREKGVELMAECDVCGSFVCIGFVVVSLGWSWFSDGLFFCFGFESWVYLGGFGLVEVLVWSRDGWMSR